MGQLKFQVDSGNYPDGYGYDGDNTGAKNTDFLQRLITTYMNLPKSSPRPLPRPSSQPQGGGSGFLDDLGGLFSQRKDEDRSQRPGNNAGEVIEIDGYKFPTPSFDPQGPQKFLNIDGYGGTLFLTDNFESRIVSPGNRLRLKKLAGSLRALDQREDPRFKVIIFNPDYLLGKMRDPKPPVNVLIHEIGHMRWPHLGTDEQHHDIRFYALLFNALVCFGIAPHRDQDLNADQNSYDLARAINLLPPGAKSDPLGFSFRGCIEDLPGSPIPKKQRCTEIHQ